MTGPDGALTWVASAIWSDLSWTARGLARAGVIRSEKLPCRVISVGNIQVGGAGKTPLVAEIAREAKARGLRTCVLCRGYGGEWEVRGGVIAPGDPKPEAGMSGDEAALLHDLAPDAWIGVGADRVRQYRDAAARAGQDFDLVILDDGFQHWKIRKDVELVAVTSASRTRVLHRDWRSALRHADLVVWTKGEERPRPAGRPLVKVRYRVPDSTDPWPVWLVTGLADGASAVQTAREAGYRVEKHVPFRDHARYEKSSVQAILDQAARAGCKVAVTGKDWVKWREFGFERSDEIRVLEPRLVFEEGEEHWNRVLWGN